MTVQDRLPRPAGLLRRMRRLWPYFGRPLWVWAVAVVATLLLALSEPLIPALLQPLLEPPLIPCGNGYRFAVRQRATMPSS